MKMSSLANNNNKSNPSAESINCKHSNSMRMKFGCAHWITASCLLFLAVAVAITGVNGETHLPSSPLHNGPTHSRFACQDQLLTLQCGEGHAIKVKTAFYGVDRDALCSLQEEKHLIPCGEFALTEKRLAEECDGQQDCSVIASTFDLGFEDNCPLGTKYLEVYYHCLLKEGYCRNGKMELEGCDDVCDGLECVENNRSQCVPNKCNHQSGCYPEFRDKATERFVHCSHVIDNSFNPPLVVDNLYSWKSKNVTEQRETVEVESHPPPVPDKMEIYQLETKDTIVELNQESIKTMNTEATATESSHEAKHSTEPSHEAKHSTEPSHEAKHSTEPSHEAKHSTEPSHEAKHSTEPSHEAKHSTEPSHEAKHSTEPSHETKYTTEPSHETEHSTEPSDEVKRLTATKLKDLLGECGTGFGDGVYIKLPTNVKSVKDCAIEALKARESEKFINAIVTRINTSNVSDDPKGQQEERFECFFKLNQTKFTKGHSSYLIYDNCYLL